ncbi:S1 family peptidase [Shewanella baltica]|uniref:S1 family peptidase n=1 Tax=Shewanella baltica TaxID=62322 RepID=UPI003D04F507
MHNSVLKISNGEGVVFGTGFAIKQAELDCYIATCGHVVNDCNGEVFVDGHRARVIFNSYENGIDLSVICVNGIECKPLPISNLKSEKVKVIGFSKILGEDKREEVSNISVKHNVEISKRNGTRVNTIKMYTNEPISYGYSGSPVICETSNVVIGVVYLQQGDNNNYAICVKHLNELFDLEEVCTDISSAKQKISIISDLTLEQKVLISAKNKDNFDRALRSYRSLESFWVKPHLDREEEDKSYSDISSRVDIHELVENPRSVIIKGRQQYGATCLAHYLINYAWNQVEPSFWLYLDANKLKPHTKQVQKSIEIILNDKGLTLDDVECVVLDEFSCSIDGANKIIDMVSKVFENKPMLVMFSVVENPLLSETLEFPRKYEELNLWALNQKGVRELVNSYNREGCFGEENRVVNKVVADLNALNIPRTPQNCLTILKISEIDFDDSPVNRTEMIRRVLYLLFNVDEIPQYKTRPDLKDTEFTLGYFCEKIIRTKEQYFTRDSFIRDLSFFCEKNEIELDVHVIFDILYANNIIVMRGASFCFKFTYWVFYFSAHRMLQSAEFSNYIMSDFNYISYPEIIEFYTGIDRRRDDALISIISDMKVIRDTVNEKCNFPTSFNIYNFAKWLPSPEQIEIIHKEVSSNLASSNLPDEVKDDYADRNYDRVKPLMQSIHTILEEYSLLRLMKCVSAGSVALRNSDYSSLELRHELLDILLSSWEQLTKVLVALSPVLAHKRSVDVDGASFILTSNFKGEPYEIFNQIINAIPSNILSWYVDQIFSQRLGPLIKNKVERSTDELSRHYLHLILITKRPKGWEKIVEKYIVDTDKKAFYLCDVFNCLKSEYKYSFASAKDIGCLAELIKMTAAKHQLGIKRPSNKMISNLKGYVLPERYVL